MAFAMEPAAAPGEALPAQQPEAAQQEIIEVREIFQGPGPRYKRGRGRSFFRQAPKKGAVCQVPGCDKSLHKLREYYKRYKICPFHLELPCLVVEGQSIRFCQQCGRYQLLSDFDGDRRSCRRKLVKHNERRRKYSTPGGGGGFGSPGGAGDGCAQHARRQLGGAGSGSEGMEDDVMDDEDADGEGYGGGGGVGGPWRAGKAARVGSSGTNEVAAALAQLPTYHAAAAAAGVGRGPGAGSGAGAGGEGAAFLPGGPRAAGPAGGGGGGGGASALLAATAGGLGAAAAAAGPDDILAGVLSRLSANDELQRQLAPHLLQGLGLDALAGLPGCPPGVPLPQKALDWLQHDIALRPAPQQHRQQPQQPLAGFPGNMLTPLGPHRQPQLYPRPQQQQQQQLQDPPGLLGGPPLGGRSMLAGLLPAELALLLGGPLGLGGGPPQGSTQPQQAQQAQQRLQEQLEAALKADVSTQQAELAQQQAQHSRPQQVQQPPGIPSLDALLRLERLAPGLRDMALRQQQRQQQPPAQDRQQQQQAPLKQQQLAELEPPAPEPAPRNALGVSKDAGPSQQQSPGDSLGPPLMATEFQRPAGLHLHQHAVQPQQGQHKQHAQQPEEHADRGGVEGPPVGEGAPRELSAGGGSSVEPAAILGSLAGRQLYEDNNSGSSSQGSLVRRGSSKQPIPVSTVGQEGQQAGLVAVPALPHKGTLMPPAPDGAAAAGNQPQLAGKGPELASNVACRAGHGPATLPDEAMAGTDESGDSGSGGPQEGHEGGQPAELGLAVKQAAGAGASAAVKQERQGSAPPSAGGGKPTAAAGSADAAGGASGKQQQEQPPQQPPWVSGRGQPLSQAQLPPGCAPLFRSPFDAAVLTSVPSGVPRSGFQGPFAASQQQPWQPPAAAPPPAPPPPQAQAPPQAGPQQQPGVSQSSQGMSVALQQLLRTASSWERQRPLELRPSWEVDWRPSRELELRPSREMERLPYRELEPRLSREMDRQPYRDLEARLSREQVLLEPRVSREQALLELRQSREQVLLEPRVSRDQVLMEPRVSREQVLLEPRLSREQVLMEPRLSREQILIELGKEVIAELSGSQWPAGGACQGEPYLPPRGSGLSIAGGSLARACDQWSDLQQQTAMEALGGGGQAAPQPTLQAQHGQHAGHASLPRQSTPSGGGGDLPRDPSSDGHPPSEGKAPPTGLAIPTVAGMRSGPSPPSGGGGAQGGAGGAAAAAAPPPKLFHQHWGSARQLAAGGSAFKRVGPSGSQLSGQHAQQQGVEAGAFTPIGRAGPPLPPHQGAFYTQHWGSAAAQVSGSPGQLSGPSWAAGPSPAAAPQQPPWPSHQLAAPPAAGPYTTAAAAAGGGPLGAGAAARWAGGSAALPAAPAAPGAGPSAATLEAAMHLLQTAANEPDPHVAAQRLLGQLPPPAAAAAPQAQAALSPDLLRDAVGLLHQVLAQGEAAYRPSKTLVTLSLKLYQCTPDQLPPELRNELESWVTRSSTFIEESLKPGCIHLTLTALLDQEEAGLLDTDFQGRLEALLTQDGSSALGSSLAGGAVLAQYGTQAVLLQEGAVVESLDLSQAHPPYSPFPVTPSGTASRRPGSTSKGRSLCGGTPPPELVDVWPLAVTLGYAGTFKVAAQGYAGASRAEIFCRHKGEYPMLEVLGKGHRGPQQEEYSHQIGSAGASAAGELEVLELRMRHGLEVGSYQLEAQSGCLVGPRQLAFVVVPYEAAALELRQLETDSRGIADVPGLLQQVGMVLQYLDATRSTTGSNSGSTSVGRVGPGSGALCALTAATLAAPTAAPRAAFTHGRSWGKWRRTLAAQSSLRRRQQHRSPHGSSTMPGRAVALGAASRPGAALRRCGLRAPHSAASGGCKGGTKSRTEAGNRNGISRSRGASSSSSGSSGSSHSGSQILARALAARQRQGRAARQAQHGNPRVAQKVASVAQQLAALCVLRRWPALLRALLPAVTAGGCVTPAEALVAIEGCLGVTGCGGISLMHAVAAMRCLETVQVLKGWGEGAGFAWRLDSRGPGGVTPFHLLALLGDSCQVALAMSELSPNGLAAWMHARADDGTTPLQLACQLRNTQLLAALAAGRGTSPEARRRLASLLPQQRPPQQQLVREYFMGALWALFSGQPTYDVTLGCNFLGS
ncbi:hypothetical protein N2152v2_011257 [Parachlorella kessleri]